MILEKQRSCQSWGTSKQQTGFVSSPRLNQESGKTLPDSSKNLAMMDAFATSRSWETTLLRSAM
eukprot:CAMPEP_0115353970 /NCGR_PEP_ID=MMETSP0270-20121206/98332_1 /TAXON_ID=71861 /ORGANISM="Scrippsiella trochoidea, Strain CCMP3099" /LENGTH=63 /DNA_ID=CAMNT_0002776263 /DNA_START=66 /DNA_END=254 /DNA_ORIENTATION=-